MYLPDILRGIFKDLIVIYNCLVRGRGGADNDFYGDHLQDVREWLEAVSGDV